MTPVLISITLTIYNFMYVYFPYMLYDTGSYFNRISIPLTIYNCRSEHRSIQKSVFPLKSYNILTFNHHTTFHSVLAQAYVLMRLKILHRTTFQPNVNHTNTSYNTDNNSTAVTVLPLYTDALENSRSNT